MLPGFQEKISLCHLGMFEQAEIFWRMFPLEGEKMSCSFVVGRLVADWFQTGFDDKAGKKNEWLLFLIYLLRHHRTSTFTNCMKDREQQLAFFFLQMFILRAF